MAKLYVLRPPEGIDKVEASRAIREAAAATGRTTTFTEAGRIFDLAAGEGHALVGEADDQSVVAGGRLLSAAGLTFRLEGAETSPEAAFAATAPAPEAPDDPEAPEAGVAADRIVSSTGATTAHYATALALMAASEGNPVMAAGHARNLARTTGETEFYAYVIAAIGNTFPWVLAMLTANGGS